MLIEDTKSVQLISAEIILDCIRLIEHNCAGWWWSISQESKSTRVNMGPGRNCPHDADNLFALTTEGDNGKFFDYSLSERDHLNFSIHQELTFRDKVEEFVLSFNEDRGLTGKLQHKYAGVTDKVKYRRQSNGDLERLRQSYCEIMKIEPLLSEHGYMLKNVYLGSCDLSADCSLRGERKDHSEFDVSMDLLDEAVIAESVDYSLTELRNDILTPR